MQLISFKSNNYLDRSRSSVTTSQLIRVLILNSMLNIENIGRHTLGTEVVKRVNLEAIVISNV